MLNVKLHKLIDSYDVDRTALTIIDGESVTYGELIAKSKKIAAALENKGHVAGDRTLILAELSTDTIAYIIALLRIGGVPVVADPGSGRSVLQSRIDESAAGWVLLSPTLFMIKNHPIAQQLIRRKRKNLPYLFGVNLPKRVVVATRHWVPGKISFYNLLKEKESNIKNQGKNDALIVFTSGTTSAPKGVIHTHESLLESAKAIRFLINHDDPIFYTHQPYFVLLGIVLGAHVILCNKDFSAKDFINNSNQHKPTITFGPPGEFIPVIGYLNENNQLFPQSYRQVMFGSAPITVSFLKKFKRISGNIKATCMYGMTEALPISAIDMDVKLAWNGQGDILGAPIKGLKLKIELEELFVEGKRVVKSYLNQKEHTWTASGDLVYMEGDNIILKARKKDMILRRSYNIYPSLYEPTIEAIEGIRACALFGVYDQKLEDERIILAIEKEDGFELQERNIFEKLKNGRHSIDKHALPDTIVFIQLPRSGRQLKIDKSKLRKIYN